MDAVQLTFSLSHTVDYIHSITNSDHPDRTSAEYTLDQIRNEYGQRLVGAKIRKVRKIRSQKPTWNIRYHVQMTKTVKLF